MVFILPFLDLLIHLHFFHLLFFPPPTPVSVTLPVFTLRLLPFPQFFLLSSLVLLFCYLTLPSREPSPSPCTPAVHPLRSLCHAPDSCPRHSRSLWCHHDITPLLGNRQTAFGGLLLWAQVRPVQGKLMATQIHVIPCSSHARYTFPCWYFTCSNMCLWVNLYHNLWYIISSLSAPHLYSALVCMSLLPVCYKSLLHYYNTVPWLHSCIMPVFVVLFC